MKLTPDFIADRIPSTFLRLPDRAARSLDHRLGYVGRERFVFFYYEGRGEEVVWNDGRTYGSGARGWGTFMHQVAPLGKRSGVNVGAGGSINTHVLLLDRQQQAAWFAPEAEADQFLRGRRRSAAA